MNIYLSFDCDYTEDYDFFDKIFEIVKVPCNVFIAGSRHPEKPYPFPENVEIGNHSFEHGEWYEIPVEQRVSDLLKNHEWIKGMYGVDCKVYRSPHLRNFPDTALEMMNHGYKPELACSECDFCPPMTHSHLKQYFSSHHYFKPENNNCPKTFLENFEYICKKGKDFTFFLDPHAFTEERLPQLERLISIGKQYGQFARISEN